MPVHILILNVIKILFIKLSGEQRVSVISNKTTRSAIDVKEYPKYLHLITY